jgi:TusE/DsrC/DsvC family sulfur relay protein
MPTREIAGKTVQVNDEGFMTEPSEWSEAIAVAIAAEEGIASLSDRHWKIINWCRQEAEGKSWKSPTLRQITAGTGVGTKELFELFPKGPAKKVAHIAGLGKPEGCV